MQTNKFLRTAEEAVSPVVATLMLVLVAAGAAVGLSVWMGGFQEGATDDVNAPTDTQVLRIGGSSTVFEFTEAAKAGFENEFPVVIELESGGSGAGRAAVCKGYIDIGSSSSSWKDADYDACRDNLNKELQIFEVAKDGVAMVTGSGNTHCTAMAFTTAQVQELYNVNGADAANTTIPATAAPTHGSNNEISWDDLVTAGICTGAGGAQVVKLGARSDPGGTEDGFSKHFGLTRDSNSQLDDTVYTNLNNEDGNQGIEEWLVGEDDGLSFIGFGHFEANSDDFGLVADLDGVTPSKTTIGSETYPAVRSLTYGVAGEPSALEQLWLDWVLNTHNNQEFAAAAGYVSIY